MNIFENLNLEQIDGEEWKDICWMDKEGIRDYTGLYQVSNLGNVRSLDRIRSDGYRLKGTKMKLGTNQNGYKHVNLCVNGKKRLFRVHRLVAIMFIPNTYNKPHIDHINCDPSDNRTENLRWVTPTENMNNPLTLKHNSESHMGKLLSEKAKQKMSKSRGGGNNPRAKKVICSGIEFDCIKSCAEFYGVKHGTMRSWLNEKRSMSKEWKDRGLSYVA